MRSSGYWITGCRRLVVSIFHKCVICRRMQRQCESQKMSDLPEDRLIPGQSPFTSVTFSDRGTSLHVKQEDPLQTAKDGQLCSCLVTRAVHIEVLEEMSSSSFINALRRFTAIRGKVKLFRSDRGTNFVGAIDPLRIHM